jgi:hypothetical protein
VIYREMPPVWDPSFRTNFYARWGQENAVISATTRRAEYADFEQLLSIKAVIGGVEEYFVDGRRIAVDDDTYLILNAGRLYGSRIHALRPVHHFPYSSGPVSRNRYSVICARAPKRFWTVHRVTRNLSWNLMNACGNTTDRLHPT